MTPEYMLNIARKEAYKMRPKVPRSTDVADMIQDALVAILQGRDAHNGIVDGLRHWYGRRNRRRLVPLKDKYLVDPWGSVDQKIYEDSRTRAIHRALSRLTPRQERIYRMVYLQGHTYKAVAKLLGIKPEGISMYLLRTKDALQKALKDFRQFTIN